MGIDSLRSGFNEARERSSTFTIFLFALVVGYVFLVTPSVYFAAERSGLSITDTATLFTPVGTVLVSLLLAALYWDLLAVQSEQVEIMDEQSAWAEAANSPAILIENWNVIENGGVDFKLSNRGNSHVEKMELLTELVIKDTETGEVIDEYHSQGTLNKMTEDGFESLFLPANRREKKTFRTGVGYEVNTSEDSSDLSKPEDVLQQIIENRDTAIDCEFVLILKSIAPGGNIDEREFYRFAIDISQARDFEYLVENGEHESRPLHVPPN